MPGPSVFPIGGLVSNLKFNPEDIAAALVVARGNMTVAARLLESNRKTVSQYVKRFPMCAEAVREGREVRIDIAEHALDEELATIREPATIDPKTGKRVPGKLVKAPAQWAVKFVLMTLGKDRGYSWYPGSQLPVQIIEQQKTVIINQFNALPAEERAQMIAQLRRARELGQAGVPQIVDGEFEVVEKE